MLIILFPLVLLYGKTISTFVVAWLGRDDYSHGFIIPFMSVYLAYRKKDALLSLPLRPAYPLGLFILVGGLLTLLAGQLTATVGLQQLSLLPVLIGLVLLNFGMKHLKVLWLPLLYLVFMLPPVLDPLIENAYWPFQLFTATISAKLYSLVGIPVLREQQFLRLPEITLEVARECSGVRYLISILALAIPAAIFTQKTRSRKYALVLLAVLIGILANPVRVLLIGVVVYYFGGDIHGPMHIFEGVSVSIVGYCFLLLGAWLLNRGVSGQEVQQRTDSPSSSTASPTTTARVNCVPLFLSITLVLAAAWVTYFHSVSEVPLARAIELPTGIGEWRTLERSEIDHRLVFHDADSTKNRLYANAQGLVVIVHVAYFNAQKDGKKIISFRNPFQSGRSETRLVATKQGATIPIKQAYLDDDSAYVTYYFYKIDNELISSTIAEKLLSLRNVVLSNRSNGKAYSVSMRIDQAEKVTQARKTVEEFIVEFIPYVDSDSMKDERGRAH